MIGALPGITSSSIIIAKCQSYYEYCHFYYQYFPVQLLLDYYEHHLSLLNLPLIIMMRLLIMSIHLFSSSMPFNSVEHIRKVVKPWRKDARVLGDLFKS